MAIIDIFLIFFAIVILVILLKVVGKIIKIVLTVFLIILLLITIGVVFAGADYRALKAEYQNSTNLFVFVNNGTLTSASVARGFSLENSTAVSKSGLSKLQGYYDESDFENMIGDYYKLLLIDEEGYGETHKQLVNLFKENNLKTVELGVRDGYIQIYPTSAFFRIIKYIPRILIQYGIIVS